MWVIHVLITSVVQMRWGYNMWVIHVLITSVVQVTLVQLTKFLVTHMKEI